MTPPAQRDSAESPPATPCFWTSTVYPSRLMLWAAAQTAALVVAAIGFPSAWPALDRLPIYAWVVAQWLLLAGFFPDLLDTAGTAAAAVAMIWPYGILAGLLARTRAGVLWVSVDQSLWVIALAGCTASLTSEPARVRAARLLRAWLTISVLLAYGLADRSPPAGTPKWLSHINPLLATGDLLNAVTTGEILCVLALPTLAAITAGLIFLGNAWFSGKSTKQKRMTTFPAY